jgi:hypothetical protein
MRTRLARVDLGGRIQAHMFGMRIPGAFVAGLLHMYTNPPRIRVETNTKIQIRANSGGMRQNASRSGLGQIPPAIAVNLRGSVYSHNLSNGAVADHMFSAV